MERRQAGHGRQPAVEQLAADAACTILTIDHHRKQSGIDGDVVADVLGSTGKSMALDTVLGLYRRRGEPDAILRAGGRDIEDKELRLSFSAGVGWTLTGDARQVAQSQAEQEALAALKTLRRADAGAIARELGKARQSLVPTLKRLQGRGVIRSRRISTNSSPKILYQIVAGTEDGPASPAPAAPGVPPGLGAACQCSLLDD